MRLSAEPFAAWHQEAAGLFRAHWELVGRHKDEVPMEVDTQRWIAGEKAGTVLAVTARLGWSLIGYGLYLLANPLNYKGRLFAISHAIYIEPTHLVGLHVMRFSRLIAFCDELAKARGAVKVFQHEKLAHGFAPLLKRNGYSHAENLWDKVL